MENHDDDRRPNVDSKKVLAIGNGSCGKTCMLLVLSQNSFPTEQNLIFYENYVVDIEAKGKLVELALWDTAGQDHYSLLRSLSYPDTDVILTCFSVDCPDSLEDVQLKWIPEAQNYSPNTPFILVGTKTDLRNDPVVIQSLAEKNQRPVSTEEGSAMAEKIGALAYLECSAKTGDGIKELLTTAADAALTE